MSKMYTFSGSPEGHEHLDVMHKLLKQFVPFAQKRLGFNKPVDINLLSDPQNSKDPLGKTAYYDPNNMKIALFVDKRHPKDLMRSLAHELTHHAQNCRGEFDNLPKLGKDYAQTNKHMREMEREAYEGTMLLRDFEDQLKKETTQMSESKINESEEIQGLTPRARVKVGGPEDFFSKERNIPASLGDKPKSRMKLDQGTEYTVGALKAMKSAILQAMLTQAKAQGKKWSDLPTDTPERIAYRQVNKAVKKVAGKADEEAINLKDLNVDEDSIIAATLRSIPKDKTREEQRMMARKEIERLFGDLDIKSVVGGPKNEDQDLEEGKKKKKKAKKPKSKKAKKPKSKKEKSKKTAKLKNPKKADLNKDGKLSSYEKKRGKAIEKAMGVAENKENWFKGDKDNLLFETLTKKWTK